MVNSETRDTAVRVVKQLVDAGHTAYLVGGCVRDMVRGAEPKDYDIATSAAPEEVMELFKRTVPVGVAFGVILVLVDEMQFEVATFRNDHDYTDGRHPGSVTFGGEKEDAERRDFTINGIFFDPLKDRLVDYVHGESDIKAGLIRTIGSPEKRFNEDKLRLLRAVRFAAALDYEIEEGTFAALKESAHEITSVSAERIRDELSKMLTSAKPRRGIELMDAVGLLNIILPEVEAMKGVEQPPQFHPEGDVYEHTLQMLKMSGDRNLKNPEISERADFAFALMLHDVGKPPTFEVADRIRFNGHTEVGAGMARKIMRRLKFPRREIELVEELIRDHLKFMEVRRMRPSTLKRFMRVDEFDMHLELHRLDCLASHGDLTNLDFVRQKLEEFRKEEAEEALRPKPLINGNDLIELGLEPGPVFKEILTKIEDMQLEDAIKTRDEAIEIVRKEYL